MWELDSKKGWGPKKRCFWTVVLEKTLESPLDIKVIKLDNTKGNQSWIFTARSDAEAEAPIGWPPDAKSWLTGKDPDAGKNWSQEHTEDELVGWHHQLNGREFEQSLGDDEQQRSLAWCSPRGHKESHTTGWLNNCRGMFDGRIPTCCLSWVLRPSSSGTERCSQGLRSLWEAGLGLL